ncbi:hypothetical protein VKT23_013505 [Stygiomarasmius scandens]|uniref:Uncharacterized protein n=1 Tax=Marasmiellus scandens TaxID=2682957 RepID=A0ABR1J5E9_9AGAR
MSFLSRVPLSHPLPHSRPTQNRQTRHRRGPGEVFYFQGKEGCDGSLKLANGGTPRNTTCIYSTTTAVSIAVALVPSLVSAVQLQYGNTYDDMSVTLTNLICSDGPNGLITHFGWQTLGDTPSCLNIGTVDAYAPFVGAVDAALLF